MVVVVMLVLLLVPQVVACTGVATCIITKPSVALGILKLVSKKKKKKSHEKHRSKKINLDERME